MTDSSREKLVSEVNSARNVSASGRLISRADAPSPVADRACVKVLIARTLTPAGGVGWVVASRRLLRSVRAAAQVSAQAWFACTHCMAAGLLRGRANGWIRDRRKTEPGRPGTTFVGSASPQPLSPPPRDAPI